MLFAAIIMHHIETFDKVDNPIEKIADLALDMLDATKQVLRDPSDPKKAVKSRVRTFFFSCEASLYVAYNCSITTTSSQHAIHCRVLFILSYSYLLKHLNGYI